jgi:Ferritin-like domain
VADPTRRRILTASALMLAAAGPAGCASGQAWPWARPPVPAPDVGVLQNVIAAEHVMVSRYTAVLSARPALAATVSPMLRHHQQHLAQLRDRLVVPTGARPSPTRTARARQAPVPARRADVLAYLRRAESDQAAFLVRTLSAVATPSLAQLMASISASEAAHAALLRSAGPPR